MNKQFNKIIEWMELLSIIAIITSSYLLYLHYADTTSFCDISQGLSCDIVNKSMYSEFPPGSGVPVSLMGIIAFLIIIIMLKRIRKDKKHRKVLSNVLFYVMILSLIFALYLIYTELFLILSICILCVALDIIIITELILSYKLRRMCYVKN